MHTILSGAIDGHVYDAIRELALSIPLKGWNSNTLTAGYRSDTQAFWTWDDIVAHLQRYLFAPLDDAQPLGIDNFEILGRPSGEVEPAMECFRCKLPLGDGAGKDETWALRGNTMIWNGPPGTFDDGPINPDGTFGETNENWWNRIDVLEHNLNFAQWHVDYVAATRSFAANEMVPGIKPSKTGGPGTPILEFQDDTGKTLWALLNGPIERVRQHR